MESIYLVSNGECLLEHNWRGRSYRTVLAEFVTEKARSRTLSKELPPVLQLSRALVFHMTTGMITYVCIASKEIDAAYALDLMHRIATIFEDYFGLATATTELIQNNFDTVTELLCEVVDNGFPLTMEPNGVRDVVLPPSLLNKLMNVAGMQSKYEAQNELSSIPWRRAKVKYTNNEIFVDILEDLTAIVDKNGRLITSQIKGNVMCTTKLSGTPEVTIVLKPASILELPSMHPAINQQKFESSPGTLSFIPPDGAFSLLEYASEVDSVSSSPIPFSLQFLPGRTEDSFDLVVSTRHGCPSSIAIEVPLPSSCRNLRCSTTAGEYSIAKGTESSSSVALRWLVSLGNSKTTSPKICLSCSNIPQGLKAATYARVLASMRGSAVSGVKVDSLKMQRLGDWKPYKGVKYMTTMDTIFRAR